MFEFCKVQLFPFCGLNLLRSLLMSVRDPLTSPSSRTSHRPHPRGYHSCLSDLPSIIRCKRCDRFKLRDGVAGFTFSLLEVHCNGLWAPS